MMGQTVRISGTGKMRFNPCGSVNDEMQYAFEVPAGLHAGNALEEASAIISTTFDLLTDAGHETLKIEGNYAWLILHALENAKALLDAVVEGMERETEEETQAVLAHRQVGKTAKVRTDARTQS